MSLAVRGKKENVRTLRDIAEKKGLEILYYSEGTEFLGGHSDIFSPRETLPISHLRLLAYLQYQLDRGRKEVPLSELQKVEERRHLPPIIKRLTFTGYIEKMPDYAYIGGPRSKYVIRLLKTLSLDIYKKLKPYVSKIK